MRIGSRFLLAVGASCAVVLSSCGDQGPVSGPGTLTAVVISPNGSEGSAVLSLFGPGIDTVTALDGWVFQERLSGRVRVAVVNDAPGALRFLVSVADTTQPIEFEITEVAGPDDRLRGILEGYTVEFVR